MTSIEVLWSANSNRPNGPIMLSLSVLSVPPPLNFARETFVWSLQAIADVPLFVSFPFHQTAS